MPLSQSLENMGVENGPKEQAFMQNRSQVEQPFDLQKLSDVHFMMGKMAAMLTQFQQSSDQAKLNQLSTLLGTAQQELGQIVAHKTSLGAYQKLDSNQDKRENIEAMEDETVLIRLSASNAAL